MPPIEVAPGRHEAIGAGRRQPRQGADGVGGEAEAIRHLALTIVIVPAPAGGGVEQRACDVRVLDLARLGQAIDAVVAAGANQIHGISFGLQNPQAAEDQARQKAVQALTAKANLYAAAVGQRVIRLVNLTEGGGYSPPPPMPMPMMARAFEAKDASTPISGGELAVRIDITGLYVITQARSGL